MPKYYTPQRPVLRFANTGSALLPLAIQKAEPVIEYISDKATKLAHFAGVIRFRRDDFKKYLFSYLFPPYPVACNPKFVQPASPTTVQLTGSNFASGSSVYIDGALVASSFIDLTHMTFVTPTLSSTDEHDAIVMVRRPDLFSGSNPNILVFENNPILVSISSALDHVLNPPTSSYIQGGIALELAGFYFKRGSVIRVDLSGSSSVSTQVIWESSNSLNATSPDVATTGVYNLYVRSPSGLESNPLPITYIYHPPAITSLVPNTGATDGGDGVIISGSFFLPGITLTVDAVPTAVTFINSTQLQFITPPHGVGDVPVNVTNSDGQVSNTASFHFALGIPRVFDIAPHPTIGSTGSVFQVTGKYYTAPNVTSMWLSPTSSLVTQYNIPQFTIVSNTSASFTMPLIPAGDYLLYLSSTAGVGVNPTATVGYRTSPIITLLSPSSGGTAGNFTVDVFGANFAPANVWTFAAITQSATFIDSTHVQLVAPPHNTGTVQVVVTSLGTFSSSANFTYIQVSGVMSGSNWMPSV